MAKEPEIQGVNKKDREVFEKYVSSHPIVVVDPSAPSRARLGRVLNEMGAKMHNIKLCSSYQEGIESIEKLNPGVVISEYNLKTSSGFDLFRASRMMFPDKKQTVFILVTGSASQSNVARAAEEDVDTFVIKPYSTDMLKKIMINGTKEKINPSPYVKLIEEGKELMFAAKCDEAIKKFEAAKPLVREPTLACYYIGQAEFLKKAFEDAENSYETGLGFNHIHFKCLTSLFDLLMTEERYADAYEIVKKIAKYFPANPERINTVLRLAIITENYPDIEDYYKLYIEIDLRTEEMIKYISAALIIMGKYFLMQSRDDNALAAFKKAATSCMGQTKFLRIIIENLVEYNHPKEADEYLRKFDGADLQSDDYMVADYLVASKVLDANESIKRGMDLLEQRKVSNFLVYKTLYNQFVAQNKEEQASEIKIKVETEFPEKSL